jgi:hypoxanthine phosphoribosyltransferase
MSSHVSFEVPTWNQIYDMLFAQAQKIQSANYTPDLAVAIIRGGLIPARVLCDLLDISTIATLQVQFYVDIAQTGLEPILKQPLSAPVKGQRVLLVDDIADTGQSLRLAQKHLQTQGALEIKTAALYTKPKSIICPDFSEKQTSRWIVFPWDTKETLQKLAHTYPGKRALNAEIAKLVKAGLPKPLTEKLLQTLQEK